MLRVFRTEDGRLLITAEDDVQFVLAEARSEGVDIEHVSEEDIDAIMEIESNDTYVLVSSFLRVE